MSDLRHFIIFNRTDNHCATWLLRALTLKDALWQYISDQHTDVRADGTFTVQDGYNGEIVYEHPLACIEEWEKTFNGGDSWNGWEIKELREQHWQARFAEVFCSENPFDVEDYIELCRPLLRQSHPRSRARGFVWYLHDGPLVTFYRRVKPKRRRPILILGRYHLNWQDYPRPHEWDGTLDDILAQMNIDYPLPSAADM